MSDHDCPPDCLACAYEREHFSIRPAYDVGEQILITIRNPWWKFWLPRKQKEWATVTKVWLNGEETRVEVTPHAVAGE